MSSLGSILRSPLVLWSCMTLLVTAAYVPSLNGPLVFDDQLNITENPGVAISDLSYDSLKTAFLSNNSGRLKRVLPALTFGINHYLAGGFKNTLIFKVTNLVIHVINMALVFWLVYLIWPKIFSASRENSDLSRNNKYLMIAAATALVWSLHPMQITSVAYVVQRMTSMSATFVLLGLCFFIYGRRLAERGLSRGVPWMWCGIFGGALLGLMCKENAALLPLYAAVIELTLFDGWRPLISCLRNPLGGRFLCGAYAESVYRSNIPKSEQDRIAGGTNMHAPDQRREIHGLGFFYLITLIVPVFFGLIYVFVYPGLLGGYEIRPFSLTERLLTESRVLWFYLYLIYAPDIARMGLFHDDFALSTGLFSPWTTAIALMGWVAAALLAFKLRQKAPAFVFALMWYLIGHSMESTFIPLELVFEHRNYVPLLGPVVLFVWLFYSLVSQLLKMNSTSAAWKRMVLLPASGVCVLLIIGLYHATRARADDWRSESGFIANEARNHPFSASSQYLYGEVLNKKLKKPLAAYPFYFRAAQLKPDEAGFLISVSMVTPVEIAEDMKEKQLSKLIDSRHISELLRKSPVSAWGLRALDVAARCVKSKHPSCAAHIHYVREWLNASAANRYLQINRRRYFMNTLFEIEMEYGLHKNALKTVKKAQESDKHYMRYYLMHADALASLGRFDDSLSMLDNAERMMGANDSSYLSDLKRMRKAILELVGRIERK